MGGRTSALLRRGTEMSTFERQIIGAIKRIERQIAQMTRRSAGRPAVRSPDARRVAKRLRRQGMSLRDIARESGCSVTSVRRMLQ